MLSFFWFAVLIGTVTLWPWWLIRRMRRVQAQVNEEARRKREESRPPQAPMVETVKIEGGLALQRPLEVNEPLIEADKEAAAMPDIGKTLAGKR